jgi:predicted dehydrogenase
LRGREGEIEIGLGKKYINANPREILEYKNDLVSSDPLLQQLFSDLYELQIKDWLRAIETGQPSLVPGIEAARSIGLIDACYKHRQLWEFPWVLPDGHKLKTDQPAENEALQIGGRV